ncbi:uncharacterized protein LOC132514313 isoform X2 [Lagenorhynchus albirostris]|uniref:uncharacterized protein LOC132514302 isoform X1 n=1 Tax=Lagenorhynchus albirostris TaxID=27610 RepID=UPI0028E3C4B6|nr:uncharacterized protein LOC132514302 isoform X1 [Lagenorhynchus albirostris]XP_059994911.1 uncharacterized protein LOC132514313 isoform X2 [Lagenorhynchus albirostris]
MAVAGQRVGLAGLREEDVSRPRPGRCKGAVLSPRGSASSFPAAPHGVSPPSQISEFLTSPVSTLVDLRTNSQVTEIVSCHDNAVWSSSRPCSSGRQVTTKWRKNHRDRSAWHGREVCSPPTMQMK